MLLPVVFSFWTTPVDIFLVIVTKLICESRIPSRNANLSSLSTMVPLSVNCGQRRHDSSHHRWWTLSVCPSKMYPFIPLHRWGHWEWEMSTLVLWNAVVLWHDWAPRVFYGEMCTEGEKKQIFNIAPKQIEEKKQFAPKQIVGCLPLSTDNSTQVMYQGDWD